MNAFAKADLAIVLGTSLQVQPAAMLPSMRRHGVPLVVINKTPTAADREATLVFHQGIGGVLAACCAK